MRPWTRAYLEIRIRVIPAAIGNATSNLVVYQKMIVPEERHDESSFRFSWHCIGLQDGIEYTRADRVVCEGKELLRGLQFEAFEWFEPYP